MLSKLGGLSCIIFIKQEIVFKKDKATPDMISKRPQDTKHF